MRDCTLKETAKVTTIAVVGVGDRETAYQRRTGAPWRTIWRLATIQELCSTPENTGQQRSSS
jgi:hypothetical protein